MKNEYNDNNSSNDDYDDDYERYEYDNDDYEYDSDGYDDDSDDDGKRGGGSRLIFIIVILLMAACGGIYFGLNYMDGNIVQKTGISNFLEKVGLSGEKTTVDQPEGSPKSTEEDSTDSNNSAESQEGNVDKAKNEADSSKGPTSEIKQEETKITFENDSRSKFVPLEGGYLYLTKDGAKFYQSLDGQKWNDTYTMTSVNAVSSGKYAIVSDVQGRNIRLYSVDGLSFSAQTDGNIVQCSVNSQGPCAVIQKYEEDYKIQVFRNDGSLLMERFDQDSGVFPLSAALSPDSRILAVSYADTSGIEIKTKILLFYVNKEESKNTVTGDFFGGVEKNDIIAPYIFSLKSGEFVVVSDSGVFAVDESGNEIWNTEIPNRIEAVSFTKSGRIVLALGEELMGKDGYEEGTVYILDSDGKETAQYCMDDSISYLKTVDKSIVIGSGKNFVCINDSAKERWKYTATQDIKDLFAFDSGNKALMVTGTEAKVVEIKKNS